MRLLLLTIGFVLLGLAGPAAAVTYQVDRSVPGTIFNGPSCPEATCATTLRLTGTITTSILGRIDEGGPGERHAIVDPGFDFDLTLVADGVRAGLTAGTRVLSIFGDVQLIASERSLRFAFGGTGTGRFAILPDFGPVPASWELDVIDGQLSEAMSLGINFMIPPIDASGERLLPGLEVAIAVTPLPGALPLLAAGLAGLAVLVRAHRPVRR